MRVYHWNRILENLIRIAMHEIILYPRGVLYLHVLYSIYQRIKKEMCHQEILLYFIENFMI